MGEAKRRHKARAKFFADHPICCYCGGQTPATTQDHFPSRETFRLRDRPKGLEMPACQDCNETTKLEELVIALLARVYPNAKDRRELAELDKIKSALKNNYPEILDELFRHDTVAGLIRINNNGREGQAVTIRTGPLLDAVIQTFGVKMGLALHYEKTGRIVPPEGAIMVTWFSNYQRMRGEIPEQFLWLLSNPSSLKQGKKDVTDQFGYGWHIMAGGTQGVYVCYFRFSLAVVALVSERMSDLGLEGGELVHHPFSHTS